MTSAMIDLKGFFWCTRLAGCPCGAGVRALDGADFQPSENAGTMTQTEGGSSGLQGMSSWSELIHVCVDIERIARCGGPDQSGWRCAGRRVGTDGLVGRDDRSSGKGDRGLHRLLRMLDALAGDVSHRRRRAGGHGFPPIWVSAILTARSTARALFSVSWYSFSGTLSATRPPPAWT